MRFQSHGVEFVFDELISGAMTNELPVKQLVFITTLVNVKITELPKSLPKIYTSETLTAHLAILYRDHGMRLYRANFHVLQPYKLERIEVSDNDAFEILPCMPTDMSTSFMIGIRRVPNLRIEHFYAGFATDVYGIMVNTKFAIWLRASGDSVDNLYKLNSPKEPCIHCQHERALANIKQLMDEEHVDKLFLLLPLFGCEPFIAKLSSSYPGMVGLDGLLYVLFANLTAAKMDLFIEEFDDATIAIGTDNLPLLLEDGESSELNVQQTNVVWLPLPVNSELHLFERLVCPKSVHYITHSILEKWSIKMTKYKFVNDGNQMAYSFGTPTATKQNDCACSKIETPFDLPTLSHDNLNDCVRRLIFAYTDEYVKDASTNLTVEDNLDRLFGSSLRNSPNTPPVANVPITADIQTQVHQHENKQTQRPPLNIEQPTTSKAAAKNRTPMASVAKKLQFLEKLGNKSPNTKTLRFRGGKKGIHFEDTSSSSSDI